MKLLTRNLALLLLFGSLLACEEETPIQPSRTLEMIGVWTLSELNNRSTSEINISWELTFQPDGRFTELENFSSGNGSIRQFSGTWSFNEDETLLSIVYDGGGRFDFQVRDGFFNEGDIIVYDDFNDYRFEKTQDI